MNKENFYKTIESLENRGWLNWFVDFPGTTLNILAAADADIYGQFKAFCLDTGTMLTIDGYNAYDIYVAPGSA
jgi:hypothetical protein